jgi:hypothetical protein
MLFVCSSPAWPTLASQFSRAALEIPTNEDKTKKQFRTGMHWQGVEPRPLFNPSHNQHTDSVGVPYTTGAFCMYSWPVWQGTVISTKKQRNKDALASYMHWLGVDLPHAPLKLYASFVIDLMGVSYTSGTSRIYVYSWPCTMRHRCTRRSLNQKTKKGDNAPAGSRTPSTIEFTRTGSTCFGVQGKWP